jgi:hypothetical protein
MRKYQTLLLTGMLGAVLSTAGCKFTGGGGLPAAEGGTATFAFQMRAFENGNEGQLIYRDPSKGVRIQGQITGPLDFGTFLGEYRPLGGGEGGSLLVSMVDQGKPGVSPGDFFSIDLVGGAYDTYSNSGTLTHGNIQQQ